jgi:cytochrome c-type biogenesis protein CcmH
VTRRHREAIGWLGALVVIVAALSVGAFAERPPRTDADRVRALAEQVACPTCAGQAVAFSNAPLAESIRLEIARQVDAGRTDEQVLAFLVERYREEVLLRPPAAGMSSLVWVLPVVAAIGGVAALAATFRRWRREEVTASDSDRRLVAAYLAEVDERYLAEADERYLAEVDERYLAEVEERREG